MTESNTKSVSPGSDELMFAHIETVLKPDILPPRVVPRDIDSPSNPSNLITKGKQISNQINKGQLSPWMRDATLWLTILCQVAIDYNLVLGESPKEKKEVVADFVRKACKKSKEQQQKAELIHLPSPEYLSPIAQHMARLHRALQYFVPFPENKNAALKLMPRELLEGSFSQLGDGDALVKDNLLLKYQGIIQDSLQAKFIGKMRSDVKAIRTSLERYQRGDPTSRWCRKGLVQRLLDVLPRDDFLETGEALPDILFYISPEKLYREHCVLKYGSNYQEVIAGHDPKERFACNDEFCKYVVEFLGPAVAAFDDLPEEIEMSRDAKIDTSYYNSPKPPDEKSEEFATAKKDLFSKRVIWLNKQRVLPREFYANTDKFLLPPEEDSLAFTEEQCKERLEKQAQQIDKLKSMFRQVVLVARDIHKGTYESQPVDNTQTDTSKEHSLLFPSRQFATSQFGQTVYEAMSSLVENIQNGPVADFLLYKPPSDVSSHLDAPDSQNSPPSDASNNLDVPDSQKTTLEILEEATGDVNWVLHNLFTWLTNIFRGIFPARGAEKQKPATADAESSQPAAISTAVDQSSDARPSVMGNSSV